jgi:hypothetical protein
MPMNEKYIRNLNKTLELTQICFDLKEAYLRKTHPELRDEEIRELVYRGIEKRKQRQSSS